MQCCWFLSMRDRARMFEMRLQCGGLVVQAPGTSPVCTFDASGSKCWRLQVGGGRSDERDGKPQRSVGRVGPGRDDGSTLLGCCSWLRCV